MDSTFIIKNMVCDRCIASVAAILRQAGMVPLSVQLGCVRVQGVPTDAAIATLRDVPVGENNTIATEVIFIVQM